MIDKSREYAYTGIPTFFKSDYGSLEQLPDYDIGAFGIPSDTAASNRSGARYGPAAIRKASTYYNPETYYKNELVADTYQNQKWVQIDHPKILDLGDVTVFPTDFNKTLESIEEFSYEVTKRAFPVILGGDHSVTFPVVSGLIRGLREKGDFQNLGIIHFDSHPDTWESYITLSDVWHGTPFRNLLEKGIIQGSNLVQIGIRSLLDTNEYGFIKEHGIRMYTISDIWAKGIQQVMKEAIDHLSAHTDGIYVSIDIDALDPAFAPGTGTPEPGGLTTREMIHAINLICESAHIVGIDLVEVSPYLDPTETTQNLAAFFFHRFFILYKGFRQK
jgi:agmatinase